jgi:hypothetical protein
MRTTLSIDDDVLLAVRERARREGRPIGDVLSDLARRGLHSEGPRDTTPTESFYGFEPFPDGGTPVTIELVEKLLDDLPE